MKAFLNSKLKPNLPYLFFVAVWFLYDRKFFNGIVEDVKHSIYIIVYILTVFSLLLIKKNNIGVYIGLIASVGVCIYRIEYLFLFLPVFLLTYLYLSINENEGENKKTKTKKDSLIDSLMVILINIVVVVAVYAVIKLLNYPENQLGAIEYRISYHSVMITVFLTIFLFAGNKTKASVMQKSGAKKTKRQTGKAISNLNIIAVAVYAAQLFAYYSSAYHNDGHFRIMFFPWFMYILIVIYNDDRNYLSFVNGIEAKIESLVNSKRDEK